MARLLASELLEEESERVPGQQMII